MRKCTQFVLGLVMVWGTVATLQGQEPDPPVQIDPPVQLENWGSESMQRQKPTSAELIQLRAAEAQRQRIARIESKLWAGIDPGRPAVAANPFTQSRYRVYVPHFHIWTLGDWARLR